MPIRMIAAASLLLLWAGTAPAGTSSAGGDKATSLDSLSPATGGAVERPDCQHAGRVDARRVRDDNCDTEGLDEHAKAANNVVPEAGRVVPDALKDISDDADPSAPRRRAKDASADEDDAPVILPRPDN